MNKLDRRRQQKVLSALVTHQSGRREREHWPQPLAPRFDQMRGNFRNARGIFRAHALANQCIHRLEIRLKVGCQPFVGLAGGFVAHLHRFAFPSCPVSTRRARPDKPLSMKELLSTTDPTIIAFATALLDGEGIAAFTMDVHMSTLEGSIGILPRRLMVRTDDFTRARRVMTDNAIACNEA